MGAWPDVWGRVIREILILFISATVYSERCQTAPATLLAPNVPTAPPPPDSCATP